MPGDTVSQVDGGRAAAPVPMGVSGYRDWIVLVREAITLLLIVVISTLLFFFPEQVGQRANRMGLDKLSAFGAEFTFAQFERTNAALDQVATALTEAKREGGSTNSPVVQALAAAKKELTDSSLKLSQALRSLDASKLPSRGAIYLGTANKAKTSWRAEAEQNIVQPLSEVRPGAVLTLWTDVNLREERSAVADLPHSKIQRVLQECRTVRIVGDPLSRAIDASDNDGEGHRVWAVVDAIGDRVPGCIPK